MKSIYIMLILCALCMSVFSQEIPFGNSAEHGKTFNINGIEVYCEIYGKGEPLLLLHGNRGNISFFTLQIQEFSEYFQVIAVDSRGQGKTTDGDTIITYELMARDAAVLIDSLGLQDVYVVGWSDGANVGLELAKAYPEKVKRMAMFAGNYKIDEHSIFSDDSYENLIKRISIEDSTEWKLTNLLLHYPQLTQTDLQKITAPILVMAGEHDVIKDEHTREMQKYLPNSELYIAKGATHMMPLEDAKTFNDITLGYLLKDKPIKTISGKVVDRENQALEYVNIGIERTNFGTMSFRNGLFELGIPYRYLKDTLSFFYVGFEPVKMPIANMGSDETIEMFSQIYSLSEVVVTAKQSKRQKTGITMHSIVGTHAANQEWALLMKPRRLPARVEKLNFYVKYISREWYDNPNDSLYFRINFYAITDSMPGENISRQNIVFKHLVKPGWNELDLRPFNITMNEEFFVSLEWLADLDKRPNKRFAYGTVVLRPRALYIRDTFFEIWRKIPGIALSINLDILYYTD